MTTKYSTPTVEAIQEDSEDDLTGEIKDDVEDLAAETSYRPVRSPRQSTAMGSLKLDAGRERERVRRTHRSGNGRRHHAKKEERHPNTKYIGMPQAEHERARRHRRNAAHSSSSSGSSSSEEEEQDHREVLAQPRAKLTSPSIISAITSLTVSTNNSSGSSGSNSTVTQASMTKQSQRSLGKKPAIPEMPMSPAVPDPPDVFAYLDNESTLSLHHDTEHGEVDSDDSDEIEDDESQVGKQVQESDDEDEEIDGDEQARWPHVERLAILPSPTSPDHPDSSSSSSSASSSVHGSAHFSETPAENDDTDRSTSPERSVHGHTSDRDDEEPKSPASTRMASQMAAAQQRQYLHSSSNQNQAFGTPNMARGPAVYPYLPASSSLSPRYAQHIKQRSLPRAEKLPVTGYELLASRLSNSKAQTEDPKIKPIYRKFEALNHRLLLHLQDEISELEEQLHRLDSADTQSRRAGPSGSVVPASRRAAQAAGGELQWHKTDILGRIGFKLAQYNQALTAFNATQSLNPPELTDIDQYREYLFTEHPIAEAETHFLDPTDDLVSVCSETVRRYNPSLNPETQTSESSSVAFEKRLDVQPGLSGLAIAIAVSVLVPILTFTVIPNFLGRMTVAALVAGGVVFTLMQSSAIRGNVLGREGLICGGIYGGVMIVIAGIMG